MMEVIMNKIAFLTLFALMPAMAYSADLQDLSAVLIKFVDAPGTYKIKIEAVNNVVKDGTHYTYTSLTKKPPFLHTQGEKNQFNATINIPHRANQLRLSVRKSKNDQWNSGGYAFFELDYLRRLAGEINDKNRYQCAMDFSNQFENLCKSDKQAKVKVVISVIDTITG